jgi:hypothetical protein
MRMTGAEMPGVACLLPGRAGAFGLGVELAGEVFQAAVDLHGDHAVARAEPACDVQCGGEVRPGGGSGEDALVAGGLAGRRERSRLGISSTSAPNARMVRIFSSANLSDDTIRNR